MAPASTATPLPCLLLCCVGDLSPPDGACSWCSASLYPKCACVNSSDAHAQYLRGHYSAQSSRFLVPQFPPSRGPAHGFYNILHMYRCMGGVKNPFVISVTHGTVCVYTTTHCPCILPFANVILIFVCCDLVCTCMDAFGVNSGEERAIQAIHSPEAGLVL